MDLDQPSKHMMSPDRIIVLAPIEGKPALSSTGLIDTRIFTGGNKLHAIKDVQTSLWYLKYEMGAVPPVMQQMFTSFKALLKFVTDYFIRRNIEIKEIID